MILGGEMGLLVTTVFSFEQYEYVLVVFLPEVREFITRHTAYNKHDTGSGWAINNTQG